MKFNIFYIVLLFVLNFSSTLEAQTLEFDVEEKNYKQQEKNDSLGLDNFTFDPEDTIRLNETNFYAVKLNSDLEKKYYLWLRKRVRDVWPYVKTSIYEYNHITDTIQNMENKRDKRKFIKERQKQLANKFEQQLKNLSNSRGQILTKLINKETNKTVYDIIKELKGGFNAFLYQGAGGAFDIDLKQTFDPSKSREDLYIAVILQRDFADGILKPIGVDDP